MIGVKVNVLFLVATLVFSQTAHSSNCVQALASFRDTLRVNFLEAKYSNHPIVNAVRDVGSVEVSKVLLEAWNLSSKQFPLSVFGAAASLGDVDLVRELLRFDGIVVNTKYHSRLTPLILAVQNGHVDVVRELLKVNDMYLWYRDANDKSPLMLAAQNGHVDVVRELLKVNDMYLWYHNADNTTPLMLAAQNGHVDVVREFVAHNIDINAKDKIGNTAFMLAAQNGHVDIVKILLDASDSHININYQNSKNQTALFLAAKNGHADVVANLLEIENIDVNMPGPMHLSTPLIAASSNGHLAVVKLLLSHPYIDVNAVNWFGDTALIFAAKNTRSDVVEQLLQADGVDVNVQDTFGMPALTLVIKGSDVRQVRIGSQWLIPIFLKHPDIKVNLASSDNTTPLIMAARQELPYTIELLLAHKDIKPNLRDSTGLTALWTAQENMCCSRMLDTYPDSMIDFVIRNKKIIRILKEKTRQSDDSTAGQSFTINH